MSPCRTLSSADDGSAVRRAIVAQLNDVTHQRRQFQKAALRLGNQIGAIERGNKEAAEERGLDPEVLALGSADVLMGLLEAEKMLKKKQAEPEKKIATLAKQLPVWNAWAKSVKGCGALTLGQIVGGSRDLSDYANPAKLWKHWGLAVMPDGRQRRHTNTELALLHGYNPSRRALMHVVGENLIRQNGPTGEYYRCYVDRKKYEGEQHPELPLIAHHKRAMRYMEKRFLRDLWKAWRRADPVRE